MKQWQLNNKPQPTLLTTACLRATVLHRTGGPVKIYDPSRGKIWGQPPILLLHFAGLPTPKSWTFGEKLQRVAGDEIVWSGFRRRCSLCWFDRLLSGCRIGARCRQLGWRLAGRLGSLVGRTTTAVRHARPAWCCRCHVQPIVQRLNGKQSIKQITLSHRVYSA